MNLTPTDATLPTSPVISFLNQTATNEQDPHLPKLHQAVKEEDLITVKELIRKDPKTVMQRDIEGNTVFHIAAQTNNLNAINVLIRELYPELDEKMAEVLFNSIRFYNSALANMRSASGLNINYEKAVKKLNEEAVKVLNKEAAKALSDITDYYCQAFAFIHEIENKKKTEM